jgi:hypothetical protein
MQNMNQNYNQGGYDPNMQGGYNPNMQGGYNPNMQGGYNPNMQGGYQQGGYNPNMQGGYNPNMQGGMGPAYGQGMPMNPNMNMQGGFVYRGMNMGFEMDPMAALAQASAAIIKQQVELLEILTGCETANRYHVYVRTLNGNFVYLFKCKEESDWCMRNCCRY